MKEVKPTAYAWIEKIPKEMWARHAFAKNDHIINNIAESFNHWIGDLPGKLVYIFLDSLQAKLISRLQKGKLNFVNSKILNSMFKSTKASMPLGNNFHGVISVTIPSSNASQAIQTIESSTSSTTSTVIHKAFLKIFAKADIDVISFLSDESNSSSLLSSSSSSSRKSSSSYRWL
ncbi:hypothetical protein M9H77_26539 [Catharanthus roseus]|uniref:Uncharacterized protein n=1 Tax=Catharanthus roseus TaxID=4058 RepID=A0ACC0AAG3_CATRO|nr:hypothetical protein M9H77_26539 [Catharanthus roseus]